MMVDMNLTMIAQTIDNMLQASVNLKNACPVDRRDFFAAHALQGLLKQYNSFQDEMCVARAITYADEMIKQLDGKDG